MDVSYLFRLWPKTIFSDAEIAEETQMQIHAYAPQAHGRDLVSIELDAMNDSPQLYSPEGDKVPCQYDVQTHRLSWILENPLQVDETRTYHVEFETSPEASSPQMKIEEKLDHLNVYAEDQHFARYTFLGMRRPYFWPLNGPHGSVVRGAGGGDHPHHYGLYIAYGGHGEDGSTNIWSDWDEPPYGPGGKMLHRRFDALSHGDVYAEINQTLWYLKPHADVILEEKRRMRLWQISPQARFIDWEIETTEPDDAGSRPFLLVARMATEMNVSTVGHVQNSEGHIGRSNVNEKAKWCDYSGPIGDGWDGIAFFDHPENPEYPGRFGQLAVGQQMSLTHHPPTPLLNGKFHLRFRVYVHEGKTDEAEVAERYADYVNPIEITVGG